jgi:hypothetical protein
MRMLKDTLDFAIVLAIGTLCLLPVGYAIVYIFL